MQQLLTYPAEILLLILLVITFLQSGIDKLIDWKGNVSWLLGHFAKTPLKNYVPIMLGLVLVMEVAAGLLCLAGIFQIIVLQTSTLALYGAILSCLTLLQLLFGQRIAKDYEGAKTIVVYFIPAVLLVLLLQG